MNNQGTSAIKDSNIKLTRSTLVRWAGLAAVIAGLFFGVVGMFHPPEILSSVVTTQWIIVHSLASATCCLALLGLTGIYARQAEAVGWLGLVGFLLYGLNWLLTLPFTFIEVFLLPRMATGSPAFVTGFLGAFSGSIGAPMFGVLANLWSLIGLMYILGGLLFGIATFRAGILSRWAGGLLVLASMSAPVAAFLSPEIKAIVAVPMGLALVWLGSSLFFERREKTAQASFDQRTAKTELGKAA